MVFRSKIPNRLSIAAIPIFLVCLCAFGQAETLYGPNVRPDPAIDALLLRLATRYDVPLPPSFYSQPLRTNEVASFIDRIDSAAANRPLSTQESASVTRLRRRMDPADGLVAWADKNEDIHLGVHLSLLGDILAYHRDSSELHGKGIASPLLTANIGRLSFFSGIDVWTEGRSDTLFHNSTYQPYAGIPYNLYNGHNGPDPTSHLRSSDLPRGGVVYQATDRIRLETAIDYLKIGPSVYYPVTLSGTAPPILYFRGRFDFKILDYSHVAGMLEEEKNSPKYFYLHRLSASLWKNRLTFGLNEMVLFGSTTSEQDSLSPNGLRRQYYGEKRDWSWMYSIPFIPFKFAEHYGGDRDNALIGFDAEVKYPQNFRWYGEFLIDDMISPWKIFTSSWVNKWATTIGGQYYFTCKGRDMQIDAEYSHVEPWVYTHFYGGSHRYTHFGLCLGSPLGPNSQSFVLACKAALDSRNTVGISLTDLAKNSSVRGGNITDVFQDTTIGVRVADNKTKSFLGPGTTWNFRPGILWNFNPFGRFYLDASLGIDLLDGDDLFVGARGGLVF
jgi:hypothetical protein